MKAISTALYLENLVNQKILPSWRDNSDYCHHQGSEQCEGDY